MSSNLNNDPSNVVVGSRPLAVTHPAIVAFMAAPPITRDAVNSVSDLIALAVRDLILCAQDANYAIDMGLFYFKDAHTEEPCLVCLAGCVIAKEFAAPLTPGTSLNPDDFVRYRLGRFNATDALGALDSLRKGRISASARWLDLADCDMYSQFNRSIPRYSDDPTGFVLAMLDLMADLKANGL